MGQCLEEILERYTSSQGPYTPDDTPENSVDSTTEGDKDFKL